MNKVIIWNAYCSYTRFINVMYRFKVPMVDRMSWTEFLIYAKKVQQETSQKS